MASPEDLTDISTSCGSSVQSACFEGPKEDPLVNGGGGCVVTQSILVEESTTMPSSSESAAVASASPNPEDAKESTPTGAPSCQSSSDENRISNAAAHPPHPPPMPEAASLPSAGVPPIAGVQPGAVPLVLHPMHMHPDMNPVMMIDANMSGVPYSLAPSFPMPVVPPVPVHLPDGTDLDLTKPPPIPPNPAPVFAPPPGVPYPAYSLPYGYHFPHIIPYDPTQNVYSVQYTSPDGTIMYGPVMVSPGLISVQPGPHQINGAAAAAPPASSSASIPGDTNGAPSAAVPPVVANAPGATVVTATPAPPTIVSVPVIPSPLPLPPMPAAGVTPLAAVEGSSQHLLQQPQIVNPDMQRSFSEEATENLKSLLNISSVNPPSSKPHGGNHLSQGIKKFKESKIQR